MNTLPNTVTFEGKTFAPYISAQEIDGMISNLAEKINADYRDKSEIVLISILDGSFIFMADLVRKLDFPHEIHFVKLKSYDDTESTGEVSYLLEIHKDLKGKEILVIEDIIDTGLTLESFMVKLKDKGPNSIKICTLLSKPEVHNDIVTVAYIGKEIPPDFIIGYGLDINGKGRNLPDIYKLKI